MSEIQDRMRRIAKTRSPASRPRDISPDVSPNVYNVADFDEQGNHIALPANEIPTKRFAVEESLVGARLPLDRLVPGHELVNAAGLCYCAIQAFPLEEARGPNPLGNLLDLTPALFHRFHPTFGLGHMGDYRRAAFIDTETTGLGYGAGVYCFMVGVGTFEAYQPYAPDQLPVAADQSAAPTHFVVRQFFMRNPAEEAPLLVALGDLLAPYEMTVTFNGRTFDLPMLRARYTQNRRFLPVHQDVALLQADRPHLDLLMPARRVWRRRLQSCRLINLEQMILGLHRSEDDVPGALIPAIYNDFVKSGRAEAMSRVFYHNNEDIITMVALAEHLSRAFGEAATPTPTRSTRAPSTPVTNPPATNAPATNATVTGMDWAGLGRAHERAGDIPQAITAYTRGLESVRAPDERAEILRALAEIYKKQKQWQVAAETWQDWITSVPGSDSTPYVELAKYCEWEIRDLAQAEMWTAWALHNLQSARPGARRPGEERELQRRLERLQRKRSGHDTASSDA